MPNIIRRGFRSFKAIRRSRRREAALLAEIGVVASRPAEPLSFREQIRRIVDTLAARQFVPPGHFYSPISSIEEVISAVTAMERQVGPLMAIDMREDQQLRLVEELAQFYPRLPFAAAPQPGLLYHYENPHYSYSDAILTFCLLNHLRPTRIVEIGSGFSTLLMADTNRLFLGGTASQIAIDPFPDTLKSFAGQLEGRVTILPQPVQAADLSVFEQLEANDVLFVDSTHVSKAASDVNRIIFEVLPSLQTGVAIHIHDIFYPFEYPKTWLAERRSWNEAYALRAFLEYNSAFEILLFSSMLHRFHQEFLAARLPLCVKNPGGSLWIRKIQ